MFRAQAVHVTVPATSANLGPGFDALALALSLRDDLIVQVTDEPGLTVDVAGEGAGVVRTDGKNLVVRSMRAAFKVMGGTAPRPGRGVRQPRPSRPRPRLVSRGDRRRARCGPLADGRRGGTAAGRGDARPRDVDRGPPGQRGGRPRWAALAGVDGRGRVGPFVVAAGAPGGRSRGLRAEDPGGDVEGPAPPAGRGPARRRRPQRRARGFARRRTHPRLDPSSRRDRGPVAPVLPGAGDAAVGEPGQQAAGPLGCPR